MASARGRRDRNFNWEEGNMLKLLEVIPGNKRHFIISLILLLLVITLSVALASCGKPKVSLSTLTISPATASPGETVSIAINVLNPEDEPVTDYKLTLTVNDADIETRLVNIAGGETKTVMFSYVPDSTGSFNIDINGQSAAFSSVEPANITADTLVIEPESPVAGQDFTVSTELTNNGGKTGAFTALMKLDGAEISTEAYDVEAGGTVTASATASAATNGSHIVEFCGITGNIEALRPAEFASSDINVSPASVIVGESAEVQAKITNSGEVAGTAAIPLKIDGVETDSQDITLQPGESTVVTFTVTPADEATVKLAILESNTTLFVYDLEIYMNEDYRYTVSYPPGYQIEDDYSDSVQFEKTNVGALAVWVDMVPSDMTPLEYFEAVAEAIEMQLPDWQYESREEIKENGTTIGYSYNYSNTVDGKMWLGIGKTYKIESFGFYVAFSAAESEWEENQLLAEKCLDSFTLPEIVTGQYNNQDLGIGLLLPDGWSGIVTGDATQPISIITSEPHKLTAGFGIEVGASGYTAGEYVDELASYFVTFGYSLESQKVFNFNDSSVGYEGVISVSVDAQKISSRIIALASNNRIYVYIFTWEGTLSTSLRNDMDQTAKSLTVSPSGIEGLSRDETLYLQEYEVPTLDPHFSEDAPGEIVSTIFSGLVRANTDMEIVPDLAENWTVSPDGLTYTFNLRDDVTFHDGKPFTASDVVYSWERACDPDIDSPKAAIFLTDIVGAREKIDGQADSISGLRIIDDYTLEVTIDAPKTYFLWKLTQPVTYIVDEDNVGQDEDWYKNPNGTGPYMLESWEEDALLLVERYDDFYEGPVPIKNIAFQLYIGYPMTLYENDEIDIAGVSSSNEERVLDPANPLNAELVTDTYAEMSYVGMNVNEPPFDDPKIREAFALAIDTAKLVEVSLNGHAEQSGGYIPEGIPGFDESLEPLPYDVDRALELISESTYGSVDNLPAITFSTIYGLGDTQEAIIGMWQQNLGIQINVETVTEVEAWLDGLRNNEYQLFTSGWIADYADPQNFLEVLFQTGSSENSFGYSNPEVDSALAEAAAETDEATRIQMYRDIEQIILDDLPAIPLYRNDTQYVLVKPRIQGYTLHPISINLWRGLEILN